MQDPQDLVARAAAIEQPREPAYLVATLVDIAGNIRSWRLAPPTSARASWTEHVFIDALFDAPTSHVMLTARGARDPRAIMTVRIEGDDWRAAETLGIDLASELAPGMVNLARCALQDRPAMAVVERSASGQVLNAWMPPDMKTAEVWLSDSVEPGRQRQLVAMHLPRQELREMRDAALGSLLVIAGGPGEGYTYHGPYQSVEDVELDRFSSRSWECVEMVNPMVTALAEVRGENHEPAQIVCAQWQAQAGLLQSSAASGRLEDLNAMLTACGGKSYELVDECRDRLTSELGAKAANLCGDDASEQERAISQVEKWFDDTELSEALVMVMDMGLEKAEAAIRQMYATHVASQSQRRG